MSDTLVIVGYVVTDPVIYPSGILYHPALNWQPVTLDELVQAPGWAFDEPTGVNNAGQIIGSGRLNGSPHGWLLTPLAHVAGQ
jgi:hypothetical protein